VSTPLAVCESRDVKGLYGKARRGEISNFTGVTDPYEQPLNAEIVLDTSQVSIDQAVAIVMGYLRKYD
jgi:adenylylsulfate kinase-like enzyme